MAHSSQLESDGLLIRKSLNYATLFFALLLAVGCGGERDTREAAPSLLEVIDDDGRRVSLDQPARRAISLIPSVTDVIMALGAHDRLIARTVHDRDSVLLHLPSTGDALEPSAEWVAALAPDLVIGWTSDRSAALMSALEELNVAVYAAGIETLADLERTTRNIGLLLDLENEADSLLRGIRQGLAEIRRQVSGRPRPSVFYVVWHDPPMTAGPSTFVNTVIEVAGGRNIFGDVSARWPTVSLEEVIRRDPDVIVVPREGESDDTGWLHESPGWRDLSAVREERVVTVDAFLFNRPGPRVVEAARQLADGLHQIVRKRAATR